ncbi:MAG: hypothetical protein Q7R61_00385 [bacterium]|nr:hypothetical protein [bacterium]
MTISKKESNLKNRRERQMKRKVAFWVIMILANAIIGVVSIRTYQNMDARITGVEINLRELQCQTLGKCE